MMEGRGAEARYGDENRLASWCREFRMRLTTHFEVLQRQVEGKEGAGSRSSSGVGIGAWRRR